MVWERNFPNVPTGTLIIRIIVRIIFNIHAESQSNNDISFLLNRPFNAHMLLKFHVPILVSTYTR